MCAGGAGGAGGGARTNCRTAGVSRKGNHVVWGDGNHGETGVRPAAPAPAPAAPAAPAAAHAQIAAQPGCQGRVITWSGAMVIMGNLG
jgi:hypothetical protein